MNTWTTVVLPIWLAVLIAVGVQGLLMKRWMKKHKKADPLPEVVAAGRRLYDDGEFMRDIVKRTPASLFGDAIQLSCGHEADAARNDSAIRMNCHRCASEWIDKQSGLEKENGHKGKVTKQ